MDLIEQYISVDPQICHGKPCFKGTRIMVWQILELLEAGVPTKEVVSAFLKLREARFTQANA